MGGKELQFPIYSMVLKDLSLTPGHFPKQDTFFRAEISKERNLEGVEIESTKNHDILSMQMPAH